MPLGVAVTVSGVSVGCAAEIVAVKVTVPPRSTGLVGGRRDTIVGRFGVTVTLLLAVEPLRLAVIWAVPGVLAETLIGAVVCPAGIVTTPGTPAIPHRNSLGSP